MAGHGAAGHGAMNDAPPWASHRPSAPADGLAAHARAVARDLDLLGLPPANWTDTVAAPDGRPAPDVLVVGAGMYGIAAGAALLFKGLRNILVLDRAADGREGPWVTTARMRTLRSPKHLPGVSLGIPSLTFRAWFEARSGAAAWDALGKVANADWQDYLTWLRRVLALPLRSGVEVLAVVPRGDLLAVTVREAGVERVLHARRVVLAGGRAGTGGPRIPRSVDPALWPDRAAHTGEPIDLARLRDARVAVLGAGPSAWDAAAAAGEAGAASVDMYVRRAVLPQFNKGRGSANPGFFEGWGDLPAAEKWRLLAYLHDEQAPPPHESVLRALALPTLRVHLGTPLRAARRAADGVALDLGARGAAAADFLVVGTGYAAEAARMPELAALAPRIATWADRHAPPPGLERPEIGRYPWLGDGFELTERVPGACPGLGRIHLFSHAAFASLGAVASDVPGISAGAERLAHRVAAHFLREDIAHVHARLEAFDEPELRDTPFFAPPR